MFKYRIPRIIERIINIKKKNEMFKIKDAVDQLHASRSTDDAYLYNLDI